MWRGQHESVCENACPLIAPKQIKSSDCDSAHTSQNYLSQNSVSTSALSYPALHSPQTSEGPPSAPLSFSWMTQDEVTSFALAPGSLFQALRWCARGCVLTAERSSRCCMKGTRPYKLKCPLCSSTNCSVGHTVPKPSTAGSGFCLLLTACCTV